MHNFRKRKSTWYRYKDVKSQSRAHGCFTHCWRALVAMELKIINLILQDRINSYLVWKVISMGSCAEQLMKDEPVDLVFTASWGPDMIPINFDHPFRWKKHNATPFSHGQDRTYHFGMRGKANQLKTNKIRRRSYLTEILLCNGLLQIL